MVRGVERSFEKVALAGHCTVVVLILQPQYHGGIAADRNLAWSAWRASC